MNIPDHLLSFNANESGDAVSVHADRAGLEFLRNAIDTLLRKLDEGLCDHEHLRSNAWAGIELSETMLASEAASGNTTVHHLEILAWTQEWKEKHGL